ncbi:hypothetical protein [Falsiroseomonas ponticola]|uniref:hypothetical protein n=1 Tax=Falsiroseomonas ponticola TaxID=2786951 RepID=UPI0019348FA9|nr:hypothetical protein [Roseomonas ponticola]
MARTNRRKPYYTLREIFERWSMDADDISAYVLEGELCMSLPVAALLMEVSDTHRAADGQVRVEPKARQHKVGPIDLSRIDAYAVIRNGTGQIARFLSATGELLEPIDDNGERHALLVKSSHLVVRHDEFERFEMEHDLSRPDEADLPAPAHRRTWQSPTSRGAPTRHDWEQCLCELGAIAHDEGLPETQAELVRRTLDWFSTTYGPENVPSESAVKQRVSRFWHRLRGEGTRAPAQHPARRATSVPRHGKSSRAIP